MSVIHEEKSTPIGIRVILPLTVLVLSFVGILLRLWYLQVVTSDDLAEQATNTRSTRIETMAPRGSIVDRNGRILASVRSELVVTAQKGIVRKNPQVMERVARILGITVDEINKKLDKLAWRPYVPVPIAVNVSIDRATKIAESGQDLPGFGVTAQPVRIYNDASALGHLLGYVGIPSADDLKRLESKGITDAADYVGKNGLELTHEKELMGTKGVDDMEVDSKRRPVRISSRVKPIPGDRLVLGIDMNLQQLANELLAGRRGAVVAIDPTSGEILCSASAPSFDASLFLGGIGKDEYSQLRDDPNQPLFNRAVQGRYAPGSTFKIVTALAAQYAGKFNLGTHYFCPGALKLGKKSFKCLGHHGSISFHDAFTRSCNVYFGQLALAAGPKYLKMAADDLGLTTKTGVDIPGEVRGIVGTPEYKMKVFKQDWYPGDTVLTGIGQGFVDMTPIQMAAMMACVANKGTYYKPHFVRSKIPFGEASGKRQLPESVHSPKAPPEFWNALQSACLSVVEVGTARGSKIPGLHIGGKTGSAERNGQAKTQSWFVGFAPVEAPKIAVAVVVENAGHGGDIAAPIGTKIMAKYALKPVQSTPAPANRSRAVVANVAPSASPSR
jgi:penicillin-binding protein 2